MRVQRDILVDVDSQMAQKENDDRHLDIFKRIEAKSATVYRGEKIKKSDIIRFGRKLKFEGVATPDAWLQQNADDERDRLSVLRAGELGQAAVLHGREQDGRRFAAEAYYGRRQRSRVASI